MTARAERADVCSLYCNSRILHDVRNKRDVAQLTEYRRGRLIFAVKAAETLLGMCLRSQQVGHSASLREHS